MTCKKAVGLIGEYLEGRLEPNVARRLGRHTSRCANCRSVLGVARKTFEMYFHPSPNRMPLRKSEVA